jgi:hypothetical protein
MHWSLVHLKARWHGECQVVVSERRELEALLTRARAAPTFGALDWSVLTQASDEWADGAAIIDRNLQLRAALDQVINAFPHDDPAAEPLWAEVLAYVQNQIAREETLLYPQPGAEGP